MTVRLSTTVRNIEKTLSNPENVEIILRFFEFMKKIPTYNECAYINRIASIEQTDHTKKSLDLKYIAVVLNSRTEERLKNLFMKLDNCILNLHVG